MATFGLVQSLLDIIQNVPRKLYMRSLQTLQEVFTPFE
jgi:hypothetical protein